MDNALVQARDSVSVQALRREIYAKPAVTRSDLSKLLRGSGDSSAEYAGLLADVAVDLLVNQSHPPKYVDQSAADWLISEIGASKLAYGPEIQMLTEVIRLAVSVPESFADFCVAEIEKAIVEGREGHPAGKVAAEDIQALRTVIFAPVDGSSLYVTRSDAEALFRIAHATKNAANVPEFDGFFAKAIGNYLMGIAFRWTPSRADEIEKEKWLDEKPANFSEFLAQAFGGDVGDLRLRTVDQADDERLREENAADARDMARASEIDATETEWLMTHLSRAGELTSAEKALLAFLRQEAPSLPSRLAAVA
ncbi:MAG: hypothetical protein WB816_04515 [Methylocystis sp.]